MVNLALELSYQEPHDDRGEVKIPEILQQNIVVSDPEPSRKSVSPIDKSVYSETTSDEAAYPFQGCQSSDEYIPTESSLSSEHSGEEMHADDKLKNIPDGESTTIIDGRKRKHKSKGQGDPSQWKRFNNAQARLRGDSYIGFAKDASGKYRQTALKERPNMKLRRDHSESLNVL